MSGAPDGITAAFIAERPTPYLLAAFTHTDVLLDEARRDYAALADPTPAQDAGQRCIEISICEVRGWILDELAARGDLALVDPAFEELLA